jgi:hypothetical protein
MKPLMWSVRASATAVEMIAKTISMGTCPVDAINSYMRTSKYKPGHCIAHVFAVDAKHVDAKCDMDFNSALLVRVRPPMWRVG